MLYNLLRGLSQTCRQLTILCASERNLSAASLADLHRHDSVRIAEHGGGGPRFIAEQRACLTPGLSGDAVLFPNYFVPPITPRRLGRVATVLHDLQYRHFPQHFSTKKRAWLAAAQSFAVRKADRLIVISDFVRQDALRWFGDRIGDKCTVIPNPISWDRFSSGLDLGSPMDRPYVLSVAAQYPHKNLEVAVRAFAEVARRNQDLQLVLCGQDYNALHGVAGSRTGLLPLAEQLGIGRRVHLTGYVDDATLGRWYRHATLFAFPSVFEGFGMPAVEALGFGLPTLTTRRTAIPETTLGLASYVDDPYSISEWAERIEAVARHPDRNRPSSADIARLRAHYEPERIAGAYAAACSP